MIPKPSAERLCRIYTVLKEMDNSGIDRISSGELSALTGVPAHTIRKDIAFLGSPGPGGGRYAVSSLVATIRRVLGFGKKTRACVVGLGSFGLMLLGLASSDSEFVFVAGFDSNINLIEMAESPVDLFPAYEIPVKVRELGIELAVLTVPAGEVEKTVNRLADGGISGILNYTPAVIPQEYGIAVRNVYVFEELRILGLETRNNP